MSVKSNVSAGIQKNIEKIIQTADGTLYSPFIQKNVEAANKRGAMIKLTA